MGNNPAIGAPERAVPERERDGGNDRDGADTPDRIIGLIHGDMAALREVFPGDRAASGAVAAGITSRHDCYVGGLDDEGSGEW